MFDERNDIWIRIFKGMAIVEFVGMIIAGLVLAINWEMFLWFLVGLIAAFVTLPLNMLMIQFFSNVQMIRENVEYIRVHGTGGQSAPVAQQPAYYVAPVNASVASAPASAAPAAPAANTAVSGKCPACGAEYVGDLPFCKKCGTPKNMPHAPGRREQGWTCAKCGFKNKPTAPFCKGCGSAK